MTFILDDESNKHFYFSNFTCKYPCCCQRNETRISAVGSGTFQKSNNFTRDIVSLTLPPSLDMTNKLEIPNKAVGEFKFWIYFENLQLNQTLYSPEVSIKIKLKCEFDKFFLNPEPPINYTYYERNTMFRTFAQTLTGGIHPTLEIKFLTKKYSKWSINISDRFKTWSSTL
jgi:hypothetical protein